MLYRVIYSEYDRDEDGWIQAVDGTERSLGTRDDFKVASKAAFFQESINHIAWVEALDKDGLWHYVDADGFVGQVASVQTIQEDIWCIIDLEMDNSLKPKHLSKQKN